ncbi:hypothetical protein [Bermanella sp. R86510]|uniref:hypothetical protein n=1 Tax=unclassified Bermanella TaxID=2627862 RepID=UPI0037C553BD
MKKQKTISEKHTRSLIAERLIEVMEELPGSLRSESELLGYNSPSTIYKVKEGTTLPDLIKLQKLSERELKDGQRPNIDWIITGKGEKMISIPSSSNNLVQTVHKKLIGQSQEKLMAILTLLDGNLDS